MQTRLLSRWSWVAAALVTLAGAQEAEAQNCQLDSDCASGYRCAVSTGVSCSPCAVARDAGPFVFGDAGFVSPWDPSCDGGCTPYEWRYCTRANCSSNADCPTDMRCHTESYFECSSAGCKPGFDCPEDAGPTCTERTQSLCTERYNLPCGQEGECGEGFDCNLDPYTTCWSSGGVVPDADGGLVFVDGGSGCETITPDAGYCNLLELPCQSDWECPEGLSCQTTYSYPPCTFLPRDPGTVAFDAGVAVPGKDDAGIGYFCPPPEARSVCRPQRWAVDGGAVIGGGFGGLFGGGLTGGFGGLVGGTFAGGVTAGGGFAGGTLGGSDAGAVTVTDAATAPATFGGALSGAAGGGGAGGAGSSDAGVDDEDDQQEEDGSGSSQRGWRKLLRALLGAGGGCSLAGEPVDSNLVWLSVLTGLLVLRTRRRRS